MDCILADKLTQPHNKAQKLTLLYCVMSTIALLLLAEPARAQAFDFMFGYTETQQETVADLPQWQQVLAAENPSAAEIHCIKRDKRAACLLQKWQQFLSGIRNKTAKEQLAAVNKYVNAQRYVEDQSNYGRADHWAAPAAFLANGGDCEDFAILKFLSLRALGWAAESLRVVVVQDTRARQPHAVLAAATDEDIYILDNRNKKVMSEALISNYAPVYSITDKQWWLHTRAGSSYVADAG